MTFLQFSSLANHKGTLIFQLIVEYHVPHLNRHFQANTFTFTQWYFNLLQNHNTKFQSTESGFIPISKPRQIVFKTIRVHFWWSGIAKYLLNVEIWGNKLNCIIFIIGASTYVYIFQCGRRSSKFSTEISYLLCLGWNPHAISLDAASSKRQTNKRNRN
jgi:hypothetical protein